MGVLGWILLVTGALAGLFVQRSLKRRAEYAA